ncbi:MAG: hypothetical protein J7623_22935 [Chitinophaga sp.]|uniref:hypothetical protein n=1 Tax=Chitinophaga sp. TaxID=1869181 RepID=UPI001B229E38|nr:hypothetical protein [Chitinophaga sp.]MBO9731515.1 hypothetical protein [Chitinophaga sp.]
MSLPNLRKMTVSLTNNDKLTPPQVISILANEGIKISEDEAEKIIEIVYFLTEITMEQILKSNDLNQS